MFFFHLKSCFDQFRNFFFSFSFFYTFPKIIGHRIITETGYRPRKIIITLNGICPGHFLLKENKKEEKRMFI